MSDGGRKRKGPDDAGPEGGAARKPRKATGQDAAKRAPSKAKPKAGPAKPKPKPKPDAKPKPKPKPDAKAKPKPKPKPKPKANPNAKPKPQANTKPAAAPASAPLSPATASPTPTAPAATPTGRRWPAPDAFPPTVGPIDLHLFGEGTHLHLDSVLGGHCRTLEGEAGASFAVWAPGARRVWITGDMNAWERTSLPLRCLGESGVHERFVPGAKPGQRYKFLIESLDGSTLLKTDPFARFMEQPPGNAAVLMPESHYEWGDQAWMERRARVDWLREPVSVYEVHLGSWLRSPEGPLTYRQAAKALVDRVADLGFTHVELMPIMEHPFGGSWGYQVTGYFAPTSRWGRPDELRGLIDAFHRRGIGVLLDWVPAHFPRDEHALHRFDGTALYEHLDPRKGHHPDWDTAIFNYGRRQVSNFLVASALYWLREYHADGIRVDAVASMLNLDYSRGEGGWEPNEFGGTENLEATAFLRTLNTTLEQQVPGCLLIAEESTAWPGVTRPVREGGLGFHLKWNMGWMHDTLEYFSTDPLFRGGVHDKLTFGMMYEHSEHFLTPLSHDEVVHGKGSLLRKMPGDEAQRFANLRCLLGYQFTRPGKQLLFMGTELGSFSEWNHDGCLDWHLVHQPRPAGLQRWVAALGALYQAHPCLWRGDPDPEGFAWIECADTARQVYAYQRRWADEHLVVVLNLTPVPRRALPMGVPTAGAYEVLLDSDEGRFGGEGRRGKRARVLRTLPEECHGLPQRLVLEMAGLSVLVLKPLRAD